MRRGHVPSRQLRPPRSRHPRPCQRGSGTALAAAAILVMAMVAAVVLVLAGYVAASHHVRAAADLVALSGAGQRTRGGDACRSAAGVAAANRVRIVSCRVQGDELDFVVTVTVAAQVSAPSVLLPGEVTATAHAGRIGLLP
ncbi:MAG: flp pilus-assembly TadE/G-like family protein [Actinobacteria bacterium]|nr:flp pilus-assembly TadE/G-like family protein [Actinomycetota bacterium]